MKVKILSTYYIMYGPILVFFFIVFYCYINHILFILVSAKDNEYVIL